MPPLTTRPHHAKANRPKRPVKPDNNHIQHREDTPLDLAIQTARRPVRAEAHDDNGEPQRGVVVVHVCDAAHGQEGQVVQRPADDGVHA